MIRLWFWRARLISSRQTVDPTELPLMMNMKTLLLSIAWRISSHHRSPTGIRSQSIHVSTPLVWSEVRIRRAKAMSFRE